MRRPGSQGTRGREHLTEPRRHRDARGRGVQRHHRSGERRAGEEGGLMLLLQHGQGRASGAIRRLRVCSKPLIRMSSGCLSARLSGLHSGMVDALPARKPLPMQPPKYYPGVGCCIFCFRTDAPLTDEHVVPLAFAGNHVMRAASCKDCAAKTSLIERRVLREYWGKSREALNFPTRRPKRRSDKLTIHTEDDGEELTVEVDWNEFPAIFALPRFERPGRMRRCSSFERRQILGALDRDLRSQQGGAQSG